MARWQFTELVTYEVEASSETEARSLYESSGPSWEACNPSLVRFVGVDESFTERLPDAQAISDDLQHGAKEATR